MNDEMLRRHPILDLLGLDDSWEAYKLVTGCVCGHAPEESTSVRHPDSRWGMSFNIDGFLEIMSHNLEHDPVGIKRALEALGIELMERTGVEVPCGETKNMHQLWTWHRTNNCGEEAV